MLTESAPRLAVALATLTLVLLLAGCGAGAPGSAPKRAASTQTTATARKPPAVQHVSLEIISAAEATRLHRLDSNGKGHDMYIPTNFTVKVGELVQVTITNHANDGHTFTSPPLGLSVLVAPAQGRTPNVVKFSFTAKRAGRYRWYCSMPCDDPSEWAMNVKMGASGGAMIGRDGYMAGYITAN